MRKILLILCGFLLLNTLTAGYGMPRNTWGDGADDFGPPYENIDIDHIDTYPEGLINVTFDATPEPASLEYWLGLTQSPGPWGVAEASFNGSDATVIGQALRWNVSSAISGWSEVYFGVYAKNGTTMDDWPNFGSFADTRDPTLPDDSIPILIVYPLLGGTIILLFYYQRK